MDLVVWPETAVLFDIMDENSTSLLLQNSFKNIENIIIGGIRKEKINKNGKIYNSLFLILLALSPRECLRITPRLQHEPF